MIQSYTQNPTFGGPKKFQEELDLVILKVQKLQSELHSHSLLLDNVNHQLEQKHGLQKSSLMAPQLYQRLYVIVLGEVGPRVFILFIDTKHFILSVSKE